MRKYFCLFVFCLTTFIPTKAQITFQKKIQNAKADWVGQTTDGGYILGGRSMCHYGPPNYNIDFFLDKFDSLGNLEWTKEFGDSIWEDAVASVCQTGDGGYAIAGFTMGFNSNTYYDTYIVKTNASGDTSWTRTYGTPKREQPNCIISTADGGTIVLGTWWDISALEYDMFLIKLNMNGDTTWTKYIDRTGSDHGLEIQQTSDHGYIVVGYDNGGGPIQDLILVKLDSSGNLMWGKSYGDSLGAEWGASVKQTIDGGYIVAAQNALNGANSSDVMLIKTDANGDTLWVRCYGGSDVDVANHVQQTSDSGYIVSGFTTSFGAGGNDIYLIKTDVNGGLLWSKTYGSGLDDGHSEIGNVQQTSDGGYILCSQIENTGLINHDAYIIKTDALGNSGCNETNPPTIQTTPTLQILSGGIYIQRRPLTITRPQTCLQNGCTPIILCDAMAVAQENLRDEINIFPNPASETVIIKIRNNTVKDQVQIYNSTGCLVKALTSTGTTEINIADLPGGLYYVRLRNNSCPPLIFIKY